MTTESKEKRVIDVEKKLLTEQSIIRNESGKFSESEILQAKANRNFLKELTDVVNRSSIDTQKFEISEAFLKWVNFYSTHKTVDYSFKFSTFRLVKGLSDSEKNTGKILSAKDFSLFLTKILEYRKIIERLFFTEKTVEKVEKLPDPNM